MLLVLLPSGQCCGTWWGAVAVAKLGSGGYIRNGPERRAADVRNGALAPSFDVNKDVNPRHSENKTVT